MFFFFAVKPVQPVQQDHSQETSVFDKENREIHILVGKSVVKYNVQSHRSSSKLKTVVTKINLAIVANNNRSCILLHVLSKKDITCGLLVTSSIYNFIPVLASEHGHETDRFT